MSSEVVGIAQVGGLGPLLGSGGQARVFAAPGIQLPDAAGPLVYKEYKPGRKPALGPHRLVKFRNGLDPVVRAKLDRHTAWPLRVVEDGGQARGVLMPLIPPSFLQDRTLPGTGVRKASPREVQNLLVTPERARLVGMPVPALPDRLGICRDLAAALHLLHQHKLVFGDLNAKNELFRLGQHPMTMLIDCDGIRLSGNAAVVDQLDSPDWDPPEAWLTVYTDRYKFGLFVLRCLSSGEQASTTRDPSRADAALEPEGRALLRAALSDVPSSRPTIQEWGWYLQYRLTGRRPQGTGALPAQPRQGQNAAAQGWVRDSATGKMTRR